MKQIIKTAGQIMEELRVLTGWNLVGGVKGDTCTLKVVLVNDREKKVDVTLKIYRGDVLIMTTSWNDKFDQEIVDKVVDRLDFPVETEIKEDSITLSHHEPLGVVEHSVKGVLQQCIIPMMDAVSEVTAE